MVINLDFINIISINVNSLISQDKRIYLANFLETNKPDIVLIGETKLNKTHKLNFDRYNLIRSDRKTNMAGGGTAVLIRNDLKYTEILDNEIIKNKCLEPTILKILV